jgi:hypothetical protein
VADAIELIPLNDLQANGDAWIDNPHFLLRPRSGLQPGGWSRLRFKMESETADLSPILYVDDGTGFFETDARRISVQEAAGRGVLLRLPETVRALRLDPLRMRGRFRIDGVGIEPVGRADAVLLRLAPVVSRLASDPFNSRKRSIAGAAEGSADGAKRRSHAPGR